MDNHASTNAMKPSLTFCGRQNTMRMTPSVLSHMGNPSHIKLYYNEKRRLLYFMPAGANELDTLDVAESIKGTTLYRKKFNGLIYAIAGWHDGLTYRVYGDAMSEQNGLRFDLNKHDILWRNKKIFVVV